MICKIIDENNIEYTSIVLASIDCGFDEKVVVLDSKKENIIIKPIYMKTPSLKRNVFIVEKDKTGWYKSNIDIDDIKVEGYRWIVDKIALNKFNEEDVAKAKKLDAKNQLAEWKYVNSIKDINDLYEASWEFHDSFIKSINFINESYDKTCLHVVFGGCWGATIELVFEDVLLIHFPIFRSDDCEISESSILLDKKGIYWVNCYVDDVSEINDTLICFKSKKLKWKITPDKE